MSAFLLAQLELLCRIGRVLHADLTAVASRCADERLAILSLVTPGISTAYRILPSRGTISSRVMRSGRTFLSHDVLRDPRIRDKRPLAAVRMRSLLVVPVPGESFGFATLAVASRKLRKFGHADAFSLLGLWSREDPTRHRSAMSRPDAAGSRPHALTEREAQVAGLLLADKSCKEVAAHLSLSPRTVEHAIERLKLRFGKATLHGLLAAVSRDLRDSATS